MKTYTLSNGVEIPVIGFGTWQTPDGDVAEQSVLDALEAGYRHIDTAATYGNEESVGRAIAKSGVPREELFVTTKLWNSDHPYEKAKAAIDLSLEKLGLDYVDLYLIHWPNPLEFRDNWEAMNAEAWKAMEEAYEDGRIKAIGVSNFHPHHLDALLKTANVKPMVNQIYLSPSDMQPKVVAYNQEHNMVTQAWSPLGTGTILEVKELQDIAARYGKSVAQVAIRWSLQHGFLPLPKSVTKSRIYENLDVFDFELDKETMDFMDTLHGSAKTALDPDNLDF